MKLTQAEASRLLRLTTMSNEQQSVWPDGAREALWQLSGDRFEFDDVAILTALEPFVQQRIEQSAASIRHLINDAHDDGYADGLRDGAAADVNVFRDVVDEIDELVPPAIGIYQTIPDRVRLVIAQRDEAESIVADLRAEVARLREDGERLRAAAVDAINAVSDPYMGHLFRAVDAYDAARSAPGGEG